MMGAMDSNRERLRQLVADAREGKGLGRQIDFVKATGLSKSTIHRFETDGEAGAGSLRAISWAVGWTPDSADLVLAGGDPKPIDELSPEEAWRRDPMSDEDMVVAIHHVVYDLAAHTSPDMTLAELRVLEDRAMAVMRKLGFSGPGRRTLTNTEDDPEP